MKTLHADLEALMPEPCDYAVPQNNVTFLYPPCDYAKAFGSARFTADQVREAMQAAAKLERQAVQAALRHEGLMLVRTQHGLRVMKAITDAEAEAASMHEGGGKTP
jgi:hypothetical protein